MRMEEQIRRHLDKKRYSEAFELLLSEYQNKVFRLAYAMLGNRALAEETAQEVFIRIWRALAGYRGQAALSTWIYAIARNACLTTRRRQAGLPAFSLDEPHVRRAVETRHCSAGRAETDLVSLIAQLPENYRQVLTLFYLEDRSYQEVSQLLDLPMGTVKTYLHRARKELAAAIQRSWANALRPV
ncbi:MAG: sigma-70 family RNA polymerase sigma factor [Acidobacteria bacterium]|nr:sigma-70 family RNA polymerase sigma factor [Acidobacteriota bacterium]